MAESEGSSAAVQESGEQEQTELLKELPSVGEDGKQEVPIAPPQVDFTVTVHDENSISIEDEDERESQPCVTPASSSHRSRKRRRQIRNRKISNRSVKPGLFLPGYQYECVLTRKAIRKMPDSTDVEALQAAQNTPQTDENNMEIYGDTSLGMKLSVIQGKVIVQHLNSLDDGRASPAQLALVQRGDVILAVNDISLVALPIDQLMQGLAPMSTPNADGEFERLVNMRFGSRQGLALLEESEAKANSNAAASQDQLLSFLMVDQLSGQPLYAPDTVSTPTSAPSTLEINASSEHSTTGNHLAASTPKVKPHAAKPLVDIIAKRISEFSQSDRDKFESDYFEMNKNFPTTLRTPDEPEPVVPVAESDSESSDTERDDARAISERLLLGRRALRGARALSLSAERVDKGDDVRSFRSWNTNLSLYSRASARRRYVLDADTALPVHFDTVVEEEDEHDQDDKSLSEGSENSDESALETDELLLRLAAHDDIWRQQVVEFLQRSSDDVSANGAEERKSSDDDMAFSADFGALLFGESAAQVLKSHKRTQALPQPEITAVLFDLTTKISSTIPDEITMAGSVMSFRTRLVPFTGMRKAAPGSDAKLAFQYLVNEALPVWLDSFKPLPWEYRRVLWPLDSDGAADASMGASTFSDELTDTSLNTSYQQSPKTAKKKNLIEMIEDQEMDAESRKETCFLATFYFTQRLLPDLMRRQADVGIENVDVKGVKDFIDQYGSYLKMHTCLAYCSILKAQDVILELLKVAKHDPKHKQAVKQVSQSQSMSIFEPTMLSAVIELLYSLRDRSFVEERGQRVIDFCTSAYPDVRPWQVRRVCVERATEEDDISKLYYTYLSALLHPMDGHDSARNDERLVKEWCELSASGREERSKWQNFVFVASRSSSYHLSYFRDLRFLLDLASTAGDDNLVFDLSNEILDDEILAKDKPTVKSILSYLRKAGLDSLTKDASTSRRTLKRVLRLYQKMSSSFSPVARTAMSIPGEMDALLKWKMQQPTTKQSVAELFQFFSEEAAPRDVLQTLVGKADVLDDGVFTILRTCTTRAAQGLANHALSSSLLKLRRGQKFAVDNNSNNAAASPLPGETIWKSMSKGRLSLDK